MSATGRYELDHDPALALRGFFHIGPAPYHGDFRCWLDGMCWSASIVLTCIPVAIFAAGVAIGMWWR